MATKQKAVKRTDAAAATLTDEEKAALKEHLHRALGCQTDLVEYRHDTSEKMRLVELYQSQLTPIFGPNPAYRRRVLERAECLLMA